LFAENPRLLEKPYEVRSSASALHFPPFPAGIEGATTEIGMENAINLESLSREFQCVELGRHVGEFALQHAHVEVVRLKSAMWDLQKQLAWQNQELCQLAEANGRARVERDSQLEDLRGAIDEVAKGQRHEREKVSGLRETVADGSAKVEEVRREVVALRAPLSECCPKVKKELTNLQQEHAKLKREIKGLRPEPEPLAPPAADLAVPPAETTAAPGRKPSNSPPPRRRKLRR
jgi:cell division protein FtsB